MWDSPQKANKRSPAAFEGSCSPPPAKYLNKQDHSVNNGNFSQSLREIDANSATKSHKFSTPVKQGYSSPTKRAVVPTVAKYGKPVEIIPERLFWVADAKPPQNFKDSFFFNIDNELVYMPFNKDFGPLNLAMVHRFCKELAKLQKAHCSTPEKKTRIFHYCTSEDPAKLTNACFLMCAFMMVILKMKAHEAYDKFYEYQAALKPFRDASKGDCFYQCTVIHCLEGLEVALANNWYDYDKFDVREYEHYEKVENGDLNWIVPGKFIAFMGPVDRDQRQQSRYGHSASSYTKIFRHLNVTRVVRLNDPKYNKDSFTNNGVAHDDMIFPDGSTPPAEIVERFINTCETHFSDPQAGAVAIHCKAGLGRTGTLIGLYCMKHYQISAEAFIGWIRIARPGSVLGPQQQYLAMRESHYIKSSPVKNFEMSPTDKKRARHGEDNQGDYLVGAKERNSDVKQKRRV